MEYQNYTNIESSLDSCSDHTPVICTLSTTIIYHEPRLSLYNKKTDWRSFEDYLQENINLKIPLKTSNDIDSAVLCITNMIQEGAWSSTPYSMHNIRNEDCTQVMRQKIAEKRKLRRQWQNNRNSQGKKALNRAQKELKQMLKDNENKTLQDKLSTLSPYKAEDYSLWKMTKKINRPMEHIPPLKQTNDRWARKPEEKSELFANFLKDIFKPNESSTAHPDKEVDAILSSEHQLSLPLRHCTPTEVRKAINHLKNKKAPGFDLITSEVLKHLPRKGIVFLTILFNAIMRLQYFPSLWKVSIIHMVLKPGKPPTEVTSYRPISLLPLLSKLFEKLMLPRLLPILEEQKTLPDHQFGFRAHHGTIEQVHRVVHTIRQSMEKKEYCSAVFLDVQQAFDRVWHDGLLCKLKVCLPHNAYMLLKSYLQHRIFQVKCGDSLSSFHQIEAGVPQGSVLGPVLYTIYTADLPTSDQVITATYADDTAVLASDKDPTTASSKLQEHLDKIDLWLKKWRIKASASKSVHITFTLRRDNCPPVNLNNNTLSHYSAVKYLGMHLDRRLTWREHIKTKRDQLSRKMRDIHWLIGRQSSLSLENKLLIYKCILKPVWTYGIELWGSASHSNVEILQRFQNKALKVLTCAPWFIKNSEVHEHVQIPTILEEIQKSYKSYTERLQRHQNQLAVSLLDQKDSVYRLKRKRIASI